MRLRYRVILLTIPVLSLDLCMDFDLMRTRDARTGRQMAATKQLRDRGYIRKTVSWAGSYSSLVTRQEV